MSYLDIDLEIKSVQNFCGCDLERCSNLAECMCCEGLPINGGKPGYLLFMNVYQDVKCPCIITLMV